MLRLLAAALLVLAVACGGSDEPPDPLVDAHAALCEAADRPDQARALFFDRSHEALHEVARRLDGVDRAQAARLLEAKERVESQVTAPTSDLSADILRLADVYRTSLGRLAITAPPCDK